MALTRLAANGNSDRKPDACQQKNPGRADSANSPVATLPSVGCKIVVGADSSPLVGPMAVRVTAATSPSRGQSEATNPAILIRSL